MRQVKIWEQTYTGPLGALQSAVLTSPSHRVRCYGPQEIMAVQLRVKVDNLGGLNHDFAFYGRDNLVLHDRVLASPTPSEWISFLLSGTQNAPAGFVLNHSTNGTIFRYLNKLWVPANWFEFGLVITNKDGLTISTPTVQIEGWVYE